MNLLDSSNNRVEAKALKSICSEAENMIERLFTRASRLKMFTAVLLRVFLATILSALFCNVSFFWLSLLSPQPYCTKSVCQEISYQFLDLFSIKKIPNEKPIHCQRNAFEKRVVFYCLYWEHSPPTNVARVQIPASTPYVGWVCCWFSPLLQEVFLRVLRFSPLLKNQHFQIPIQPGIR